VSPQTHGHEGKTKVFVTLRQGKKNKKAMKYPFPAWTQAPTLTLTATLSPNHYTMSNFRRPCTQLHLYAELCEGRREREKREN